VRRHQAAGGDWRDVINELRPHTPQMWRSLPLRERRRFLDRVVPYWDVHRHRLAPSAHLRLQRMLATGQVQALAGRILSLRMQGDVVCMALRRRADDRVVELRVGAVVNCTGPNYDLARVHSAVVVQLLRDGMLRQDPLKLGLEVDARYRVIGRDGCVVPGLYYVGPMLKAAHWEAIAVPELRMHCAWLGVSVLDDGGASVR